MLFACKYSEMLFFSYKRVIPPLVFHKRVNWIRANESSPLVPRTCLLSFVSNGNLILLFFSDGSKFNHSSQVVSYCSRILNKKEAFISGRFLRLSSSSLFMFNEHLIYGIFFGPILLKTAQMFFENCVGPSKSAI